MEKMEDRLDQLRRSGLKTSGPEKIRVSKIETGAVRSMASKGYSCASLNDDICVDIDGLSKPLGIRTGKARGGGKKLVVPKKNRERKGGENRGSPATERHPGLQLSVSVNSISRSTRPSQGPIDLRRKADS